MRYDQKIHLIKNGGTVYDYETGNHISEEPTQVEKWANISNQTEERMNVLYGKINEKSLIVRLLNHYDKPFDKIEYNGELYQVDSQRRLRREHVFHISEVQ